MNFPTGDLFWSRPDAEMALQSRRSSARDAQHAMLRIEQFLAKVRTLDYVDAESTASGKAGWLYGMTSRSIS
jgi:hypothetical protein